MQLKIKVLGYLLFSSFGFVVLGAIAKLYNWENANFVLEFGLLVSVMTWIAFVYDINQLKINKRLFWIISILMFPTFAMPYYLLKREELLKANH
ncbi:hypothetical protein [Psychroflexus salis]|uniref:Phospholipase_D-nuclease N-terminal n=1 Tax=Psychroflexus salis TaxID=1526574 RepID=A0A917EBZ1_9FLAO|nr:hypothetical protein [Psychroflexus salis]GGE19795.1 hypothetical protein GCM10010831_21160 [Psychroflexus salis]